MTKDEAIKLMSEGVEMTHAHFADDEWAYMDNEGSYILEDGVELSHREFWQARQGMSWQNGWERYPKGSSPDRDYDNIIKDYSEIDY